MVSHLASAPQQRDGVPGPWDLVAAVVQGSHADPKGAAAELRASFRNQPCMEDWAIVWPSSEAEHETSSVLSSGQGVHLSTAHHSPGWMCSKIRSFHFCVIGGTKDLGVARPRFVPVLDKPDPRPDETIPGMLLFFGKSSLDVAEWMQAWGGDIDTQEVWQDLEGAGLGKVLTDSRTRFLPAGQEGLLKPSYKATYGAGGGLPWVAPAVLPGNERRRQWCRVATSRPQLPWKDIVGACFLQKKQAPPLVDLLGWGCVRKDQAAIHALMEALLRGRMATMAWCSSQGGRHYTWAVCLKELRCAAVFVARLRRGRADLRFLARDVQQASGI